LRGASRLLGDPDFAAASGEPPPSAAGLRRCVMRLGLARLREPHAPAGDWAWMIDHTAQAGPHHVLAVVGVRASRWPGGRALSLADLELLALEPQPNPTAEAVLGVLHEITGRLGAPRVLLSDHGRPLRLAAREFSARHPGTVAVYDLLHWAGNWLRHGLEKDPAWGEFQRQLSLSRVRLLQTADAAWKPPPLRRLARYLNLGRVWGWAGRVLGQPEASRPGALAWLEGHRPALARWSLQHEALSAVLGHVRVQGLSARTAERCLAGLPAAAQGSEAAEAARKFLKGQTARMAEGDRWPGTTEVLESAFGRLKQAAGNQRQEGCTGWLLSLGAYLKPWTQAGLAEALSRIPYKQVRSWVRNKLGETVPAARCRIFQRSQKRREPDPLSTPTL
jgi:hypothetical protein